MLDEGLRLNSYVASAAAYDGSNRCKAEVGVRSDRLLFELVRAPFALGLRLGWSRCAPFSHTRFVFSLERLV